MSRVWATFTVRAVIEGGYTEEDIRDRVVHMFNYDPILDAGEVAIHIEWGGKFEPKMFTAEIDTDMKES